MNHYEIDQAWHSPANRRDAGEPRAHTPTRCRVRNSSKARQRHLQESAPWGPARAVLCEKHPGAAPAAGEQYTMIEGWHFILHSQKRHYFNDGRSLCGRFYAVSPPVSEELNRSDVAHFYNCVPCERKLKTGSTRRWRVGRT